MTSAHPVSAAVLKQRGNVAVTPQTSPCNVWFVCRGSWTWTWAHSRTDYSDFVTFFCLSVRPVRPLSSAQRKMDKTYFICFVFSQLFFFLYYYYYRFHYHHYHFYDCKCTVNMSSSSVVECNGNNEEVIMRI